MCFWIKFILLCKQWGKQITADTVQMLSIQMMWIGRVTFPSECLFYAGTCIHSIYQTGVYLKNMYIYKILS